MEPLVIVCKDRAEWLEARRDGLGASDAAADRKKRGFADCVYSVFVVEPGSTSFCKLRIRS